MEVFSKPIKPLWKTDVLVVGGGSAGVPAAIAAAREGASVTLIERYGVLGGASTLVLDTFCGCYVVNDPPQKIVGGIAEEVVATLLAEGSAEIRPSTYHLAGHTIVYNPHILKIVWETLAQKAGVRLLYHTFVVDVLRDGDRLTGVVGAGKDGLVKLEADVVIDASGDADVAAAAGVPFEGNENGAAQALTTTFRVGNVDTTRASQINEAELTRLMEAAVASGKYDLPRKGGGVYISPLPGVVSTNLVRITGLDATDSLQLTQAEIEGRRQALVYFHFLRDCVPGYENAFLAGLSTQIGIRESRRILGEYHLTRQDVLAGRRFDDGIGLGGWPMEDHRSGDSTHLEFLGAGRTYAIPFRCLLPQNVEGLLVAGRCLSADHAAHASVRVMGQCMVMGQAAGTAAALAVRSTCSPRAVSIAALQERLRQTGAIGIRGSDTK